ncbi:leucine-rich repeat domain-containing protein [Pseudoalteromonas rubra]|uniref:Bacterial repeat domain-containing protein n=1 Tax=Pseudoalteromonas rubra TaxID=43658 RepID=A0A0U3GFV1_9GAMM|nr:leucine-rich repeat domain-containing protein [Pseudoalteromonas rubra]ALU43738.1 hypothetical protein AT705_12770 [Pseudoalteromonas rubra]
MTLLTQGRCIKLSLVTALSLVLAGCGGGSDAPAPVTDKAPDPIPSDKNNPLPTVSIADVGEQLEQNAFSLTANASDDGSIAGYAWTYSSSLQLTEADTNSATPTYTVPDITQDATITFTVTVTDDKGATNSASKDVLIKRKVNSVTLNGIVTDQPISNANVVVSAGSAQAEVTASGEGLYTATLTVDESEVNSLVRVSATGVGAQDVVEFVSVLNSVATLTEQAGEDGILDKEENFGVNITNVTTAEYALMTRTGAPLTTDVELDQALLNVDADEKITLASLIKIVVDNDNYSLPEGVSSTLDLVDDEQTAQAYEDDVNASDPNLIEDTKKEIKEDDDLIDDSVASLNGDFILQAVKNYDARPYHVSLNEDGTGSVSAINTVDIESWKQENSTVSITLKQPLHISTWENNHDVSVFINSLEMTILAENDVFRTVDIVELGSTITAGDMPGTETYERKYTSNLLSKLKTAQPTTEELVGVWYMDITDADGNTEKDPPQHFEFKADGQIVALDDLDVDEEINWRLDGNTLVIDYQDPEESGTITFWFTKKLGAGYQVVTLDTSDVEWPDTEFGLFVKAQPDARWTEETVAGRWHGFIGKEQERFYTDQFSTGELYINTFDYAYTWNLAEEGKVFYRNRYWQGDQWVGHCDVAASNCSVEARVAHRLIAIADDHYYVTRIFERFDREGNPTYFDSSLFIYQYNPTISQTEFLPRNLEHSRTMWARDEEAKSWVSVDFGRVEKPTEPGEWHNQLVIGYESYTYTLSDGKLAFTRDEQPHYVELLDYNAERMQVCVYEASKGCQEASKQDWYYHPTVFEVRTETDGNGYLSPDWQQVVEGHSTILNVEPNSGYRLDTIEGCNGELAGYDYMIPAVTESCQVSATFKIRESLAAEAGITDPVLAKCVDDSDAPDLSSVRQLFCGYQNVVMSTTGLDKLTNLHSLSLTLDLDGALDLSALTQLNYLELFNIESVESIVGIDQLTNLRTVRLTMNSPGELNLSLLAQLPQLTELTVHNSDMISSIAGLDQLTNVQSLSLSVQMDGELDLSVLTQLTRLSIEYSQYQSLVLPEAEQLYALALIQVQLSDTELAGLNLSRYANLSELNLSGNLLTNFSGDDYPGLTDLTIEGSNIEGQLATLKVDLNAQLRYLDVSENQLTELDISANSLLERVHIENNRLTQLVTGSHPELTSLGAWSNQLTELTVAGMPQLVYLDIEYNQLSQLDVSNNPNLDTLWLNFNKLTALDLSKNTQLNKLYASELKQLSHLDLSQNNLLEVLYLSNNEHWESFTVADLSMLQTLAVNGSPQLYSAITQQSLPALIELDVSDLPASLVNLADFPMLKTLSWRSGGLTTIDLAQLPELISLDLSDNPLETLDVSQSKRLEWLTLENTSLTSLDTGNLSELSWLAISRSQITALDLQQNHKLDNVNADNGALESVTGLEVLENPTAYLSFYNNPLNMETVTYFTQLREQGYSNLYFNQQYTARMESLGNGGFSLLEITLQFGEVTYVDLYPDTGFQVGDATGCPGELSGTSFLLGPLVANCTLQVEFVPVQ